MTSPRVTRGRELLAELPGMLAAANLDGHAEVTITDDVRKLDKAKLLPGIIVLQPVPSLTFPAPGIVAISWQLLIVAGPADDVLAAWDRLDALLEALRVGGLHIESAEPGDYPRPDNPVPLPGYTVTVADQLDDY